MATGLSADGIGSQLASMALDTSNWQVIMRFAQGAALEAPNLAPKTSLKNSLILSQGGWQRGKCAKINKSGPPARFLLIFEPIRI